MGVDLADIVSRRKVSLEELSGKSVAVDGYNALYQFLSIIRGVAGEPLMDRSGRVTSHLSGLFYRTVNLVEKGIKLVYVFDGKPPALKEAELKYRMAVKDEAVVKYKEALRRGELDEARKYAQMTSRLKDEMVEDAKRLISLLGVPWVQAPSEGEAQAAYMAFKGDVWAASSQDYDSLLFNAPRLVRNLTLTGRRKLPGKNIYVEVEPEIVELNQVLDELGITREQLVDLGILIGTDFNPEGVKGLGPKTALKLLKEYKSIESIQASRPMDLPFNLEEIRSIFLRPEVTDDYRLEWTPPRSEEVVKFLCGERDFNESRVRNALTRLADAWKRVKEKRTLESYF
ncbi:MAG: flap endonuclease-1 [Candidatus Bathyarchaeia archaeon]